MQKKNTVAGYSKQEYVNFKITTINHEKIKVVNDVKNIHHLKDDDEHKILDVETMRLHYKNYTSINIQTIKDILSTINYFIK